MLLLVCCLGPEFDVVLACWVGLAGVTFGCCWERSACQFRALSVGCVRGRERARLPCYGLTGSWVFSSVVAERAYSLRVGSWSWSGHQVTWTVADGFNRR